MRRRRLYKLLKAYRKGTCTPQELALLHKWMDQVNQEQIDIDTQRKETIKEEIWHQQLLLMHPVPAAPKTIHMVWRIAAISIGLLAGLYILFYKAPVHQVILADKSKIATDSLLANNTNDTLRYALSDGSVITLSPQSTARIALPWNTGTRSIHLNGEALFETAKDHLHPFTVHAKGFVIVTLGTVFRVTAYDSMSSGSVKLLSGKIMVRGIKDTVYLNPGNEYSFNGSISKPAHLPVNAANTIEYTDDGIAFHNTPLLQVFKTLADAYGETIKTPAGRSFTRMKYTGVIKKQSSLDNILGTLTDLNDLSWVRKDSAYYILTK
jgi:transmembrane sensor